MKTIEYALFAVLLLVTGCAHDPTSRQIGTATGAVVGGLVGNALTGGSTVGTVVGAGAGALVGNEVGGNHHRR